MRITVTIVTRLSQTDTNIYIITMATTDIPSSSPLQHQQQEVAMPALSPLLNQNERYDHLVFIFISIIIHISLISCFNTNVY